MSASDLWAPRLWRNQLHTYSAKLIGPSSQLISEAFDGFFLGGCSSSAGLFKESAMMPVGRQGVSESRQSKAVELLAMILCSAHGIWHYLGHLGSNQITFLLPNLFQVILVRILVRIKEKRYISLDTVHIVGYENNTTTTTIFGKDWYEIMSTEKLHKENPN